MLIGNSLLLVVVAILTTLALIMAGLVGIEVIRLLSDFAANAAAERTRRAPSPSRRLTKSETGPLGGARRQVDATNTETHQERATVERLIDYFKEGTEEQENTSRGAAG